eukprot:UN00690
METELLKKFLQKFGDVRPKPTAPRAMVPTKDSPVWRGGSKTRYEAELVLTFNDYAKKKNQEIIFETIYNAPLNIDYHINR